MLLKTNPNSFMKKSVQSRTNYGISRQKLSISRHLLGQKIGSALNQATHMLLRITAEFYQRITKLKLRQNCVKLGSPKKNVPMVILVPLLMEKTSFRKRSMCHRGTRPSFASNSMKNSIVLMAIDANLSILISLDPLKSQKTNLN
jgi:hypothetical protein